MALIGFSTQMLLPGHPQLEARLNANASAMATFDDPPSPEHHFSRALGWFNQIGLDHATARTVVGTVQAPLEDGVRQALLSLFGMLWGGLQSKMSDEDRGEFLRLTEPDSPDCILDSPAYYAYFTYSVFDGRVAAQEV